MLALLFSDHNRLSQQQSPVNGSPRSSIRSSHSTKATTPPPSHSNTTTNRKGIVIDALNVSPKAKVKEHENNNSSKIVNKNSMNVNGKMQQQEQKLLQKIIDQQAVEKQKQMLELLHANKSVEALGVLVQYLVFNVSTDIMALGVIFMVCVIGSLEIDTRFYFFEKPRQKNF